MVGAVLVRGDEVVGEGYHAEFGGPHAEIRALAAAGDRARAATLYVSLEPCAHHGKTPPCADAIVDAGVGRVVVAIQDPSPAARGGALRLRAAGIEVTLGVEAAAACELNAPFFNAHQSSRPWVALKLALSIDGAIADAARSPGWLTGPKARAEVHRLRAGYDAIAVGLGTVLADDPSLTVRGRRRPRRPPLRVVFDDEGRLPVTSTLVRTARETPTAVIVRSADRTRVASLADAGVRVIEARESEDGLRALAADGVRSVLVEGGAGLAGRLLERSLIDRLIIFRSPIVLGAGALGAFAHAPGVTLADVARLPVLDERSFGDDTMTVYALRPPPCSPV
jgi:diaminohydroxyphosphoribosylaminopyrimidine deaminase/5-amino-6-(5-phosphoribosylamino)uracil reductase